MTEDSSSQPSPTFRWLPGRGFFVAALMGMPVMFLDSSMAVALGLLVYGVLLALAWLSARRFERCVPRVTRELEKRMVVGIAQKARLVIKNPSSRTLRISVREALGPGVSCTLPKKTWTVRAYGRVEIPYTLTFPKRGYSSLGRIHLRIEQTLSLGALQVSLPTETTVQVYPNVLGMNRGSFSAQLRFLEKSGMIQLRQSGGGGDFSHLTEYEPSHSYKDIDWKATAKRHGPIVKVLQQERSQRIILCIDTARMMSTRIAQSHAQEGTDLTDSSVGTTKLDHAIVAALLVAFVALRQGDQVGAIVFSDRIKAYVPAASGQGQYKKILEALFAVESERTYADFKKLTEFIKLKESKRALLLLFSDLLDESYAAPFLEYAPILNQKHLPLCITMDDPIAQHKADQPVTDRQALYDRIAASDLLADRAALVARLRSKSIDILEASAANLAVQSVQKYLTIKAKHTL